MGQAGSNLKSSAVNAVHDIGNFVENTGQAVAKEISKVPDTLNTIGKNIESTAKAEIDNFSESLKPTPTYQGGDSFSTSSDINLEPSQEMARLSAAAAAPLAQREGKLGENGVGSWKLVENGDDYMIVQRGNDIVIVSSPTRTEWERAADEGSRDYGVDSLIALGVEKASTRYRTALNRTKQILRDNPNANVFTAGTSLGGRIAEDVASELDLPSYSFNAGSSPAVAAANQRNQGLNSLSSQFLGHHGRSTHYSYVVEGDWVSANEQAYNLGGNRKFISQKQTSDKAHSILNFW